MSHWFYEKKDFKSTPTIQDGISYETEHRYRREGARFIINMGNKLNLYPLFGGCQAPPMLYHGQYDTIATGIVYFHRFYMFHSFKTFPRYVY
ncbi:CCNK [Cordylochernes scorpioides]|uniref:CCNK n=1 Tax=Cordylochernes scorpioides TaxID=51811 RepID=A0ABY6L1I3_9ARAC|nr:CCNK [Cordylochernes scorpioides]